MKGTEFLFEDEASQFLRIDRRTLKRLIKMHELPHLHVGKRRVYRRDWLVEWLELNQTASTEIELADQLAV